VTRSTCTLRHSGTQFDGRFWKNKLADMNTGVLFSNTRHSQANAREGFMEKIGKFCAVYCHEAHKDGQKCCITFKACSTVHCQFHLPAAFLSWCSIVLGLTSLKSSLRKVWTKLPAVSLQEVCKSVRQNEAGGSETKQMEQNCSSNLELQLGDIFLAKCQAVSDGIAKTLWWALESHASDKTTYVRGCKLARQNNDGF
jgi:hypothetical protein